MDSDLSLLDSDPDSDSRCPDSHITGTYSPGAGRDLVEMKGPEGF